MFITFEGPDGSGKTTALNTLVDYLKSQGIEFILTREPGSELSKESRAIREILINPENNIPAMAEAILFSADRRIHLEQVIWPALKENKIVLCDRYVDSSLAYQGAGRKLGIEEIKTINEVATNKTYPDLTVFFDITPEQSAARIEKRGGQEHDRMELAGQDFHKRVYEGYQTVIKMFPNRFEVVDATMPREKVFETVKDIVLKHINK